jgi:hypothetical protein
VDVTITDADFARLTKLESYAFFGIKEDATADQIKAAYKSLVFKFHPDRHNQDKNAQEIMIRANLLYPKLLEQASLRKSTQAAYAAYAAYTSNTRIRHPSLETIWYIICHPYLHQYDFTLRHLRDCPQCNKIYKEMVEIRIREIKIKEEQRRAQRMYEEEKKRREEKKLFNRLKKKLIYVFDLIVGSFMVLICGPPGRRYF